MRIAIFTDTFFPQVNGVVTSILSFVHEFEQMGHKVMIMAPKIRGYHERKSNIWRFRSFTFPFQPEYKIIVPYTRKLRNFKNLNIDIIHAQTPFSMGYLAQYLGWKNKIPVVHTYHTFFAEYLHYLPLLPKKYMTRYAILESRRFCNRCQSIIAPTKLIKDKLEEFGVTRPINIIPTGVDIPKDLNLNTDDFRSKYNIPRDKDIIIFVGRLGKEKNVHFMLESFKLIHKSAPNTILFIAGDGPQKKFMKANIQKAGLLDKVIFAGYISSKQVFEAFNASKIYIFPSKTETQGLTVVESLAMGTPAVCIKAMGVEYVLANEKGGFLTEDNLEAYTKKALLLLKNQDVYKEKQAQALERSKTYSSKILATQMLKIYQKALDVN